VTYTSDEDDISKQVPQSMHVTTGTTQPEQHQMSHAHIKNTHIWQDRTG